MAGFNDCRVRGLENDYWVDSHDIPIWEAMVHDIVRLAKRLSYYSTTADSLVHYAIVWRKVVPELLKFIADVAFWDREAGLVSQGVDLRFALI